MSNSNGNEQVSEDPWLKYLDIDEHIFASDNPLENKQIGRSFNASDRLKIRQNMKKMIEKVLLPFLEKKIRILEGNVANTRKGFKN